MDEFWAITLCVAVGVPMAIVLFAHAYFKWVYKGDGE